MSGRWTEPRHRALRVLWEAHRSGREATISNQTSDLDSAPARLTVYWQAAEWFRDQGIASCGITGPIELTEYGQRLASEAFE